MYAHTYWHRWTNNAMLPFGWLKTCSNSVGSETIIRSWSRRPLVSCLSFSAHWRFWSGDNQWINTRINLIGIGIYFRTYATPSEFLDEFVYAILDAIRIQVTLYDVEFGPVGKTFEQVVQSTDWKQSMRDWCIVSGRSRWRTHLAAGQILRLSWDRRVYALWRRKEANIGAAHVETIDKRGISADED